MGYILNEDGKDLLATVKEFCEKEVKEQSKAYDVSGEFPEEIYAKGLEMGLGSLEVPEEYGGLGIDKITAAALYEEMAKADAGFFTTFAASNLGYKPVLIAGTEEQKQWASDILLEGGYGAFCLTEPMGGSDPACCKTTAVKDGDDYIINGRKCFITHGAIANFYVVTCATDKTAGNKGISAFLIPSGTEGLSAGNEENKMGIRTSNTTDVVFEDVRVPASAMLGKEGEGFKIAMKTLDMARTTIGVGAVGVAQRAIDEAVAYSKQRVTFGQPIGKFEAIQFMIADMEIKTLTEELHSFGIRINEEPPDVIITPLVRGGVVIDKTVPQTHLDDEMLKSLATANRFRSGHILIREDITVDRFIDAFNVRNLKYIPAMFVYNKIDTQTIEEIDRLAHLPRSVVASVIFGLNLDKISQMIYKMLNITRVYTKPQGEHPDFEEAVLLRGDTTVRALCNHIHRELINDFKGAQVWGSSVKRPGQIVGLTHCLEDEDVVCIKTNKT